MGIRFFCLRESPKGLLIGRVWSSRTVDYKDFKPVFGGLFCESVFGPLKRGVCACQRSSWSRHPKLPKKLRRIEVLCCSYCIRYPFYVLSSSNLKENTFYQNQVLINYIHYTQKKVISDFSILKFFRTIASRISHGA